MPDNPQPARVLQMRLVVEAADYDAAVRFYRDVLGATEELQIHGDGGEKVTILDVGRATLELSNPAQVSMIDRVEVGRPVSPQLRVAFEVADAEAVTAELVDGGRGAGGAADPDPVGLAERAAVGSRPGFSSPCSRSEPTERGRRATYDGSATR